MKKIEKYLHKRVNDLTEEKVLLITKINKITIELEEVDEMISHISNDLDMAFEIFSPKPKKNDFSREEINKLTKRKNELESLRDEFVNQCMVLEEDIAQIEEALDEKYEDDLLEKTDDQMLAIKFLDEQECEKHILISYMNNELINIINDIIYKCDITTKIMDADTTRAKLELEMISNDMENMKDGLQNLIYDLQPFQYFDINIKSAIDKMIDVYNKKNSIRIELLVSGDEVKLSPLVEMICIRMIHEMIKNSIEHSVNEISINLSYEDEYIKVEILYDAKNNKIEDALCEQDSHQIKGLTYIRRMVDLFEGDMKVENTLSSTAVIISLPI